MNQISPERLREIYDRCGGDAALIGKELGISHLELANQVIPPNLMPSRIRKPPTNVGVDYFRQYIVSIKHADHSTWPQADFQAIEEARSKYEAGTHTMTQATGWGSQILQDVCLMPVTFLFLMLAATAGLKLSVWWTVAAFGVWVVDLALAIYGANLD